MHMWRTFEANRNVSVSMLFFNIVIFLCSFAGGFLFVLSNPSPRPVEKQPTNRTLSKSVHCSNTTPYCALLGQSVCSSHEAWATYNCQMFCGKCTAQTVSTSTASSTSVGITASTINTRLTCPVCDENLNCVWNHTCFHGEVCMIRNTPFTVHCSKKQDCIFMKTLVNEIACCEDRQCISKIVP
nr:uncharacterized protein LOC117689758 [Crassostrea gigas]